EKRVFLVILFTSFSGSLVSRIPGAVQISLDDELRIYSNEQQVASHRLCSAASSWQTVPEHHAPLWQQVSQVEHRPLSTYEELL
ncbi:hypothetical protein P2S17_26175, partial [Escherichia coli]